MTTTQTRIIRGYHGWQAETEIQAPELGEGKVVVVNTTKRSNGLLSTNASVQTIKGSFRSLTMFQDLSRTLDTERVRVTEAAVTSQHKRALGNLEGFMSEARAKYCKEVAA